jgi:hypothetical protein
MNPAAAHRPSMSSSVGATRVDMEVEREALQRFPTPAAGARRAEHVRPCPEVNEDWNWRRRHERSHGARQRRSRSRGDGARRHRGSSGRELGGLRHGAARCSCVVQGKRKKENGEEEIRLGPTRTRVALCVRRNGGVFPRGKTSVSLNIGDRMYVFVSICSICTVCLVRRRNGREHVFIPRRK